MLIVNAYRDLMETSVSIGKRFNVSDTYAHKVFNRYVKLNRLTFTDAISIDEVHIDMDNNGKYALPLMTNPLFWRQTLKKFDYPFSLDGCRRIKIR